MLKCKHCEQEGRACICTKVDSFFNDNWDLLYVWHAQAEYKFAYAVPKPDKAKKEEKPVGAKAA